ncbi:hypothetical protein [Kribbella soli]|uniref:Uncharacterized protein n=1 Tax=Kribbella soli TaxID=1124743 RepID=A0A4R0HH68_9ACTN|nr:hypothetical protein [Kribbella soli]TCC10637.1 hypothetical protein E0H45_04810 [Kribbella soli]
MKVLNVLRATAGVHALAICLQPVVAGVYLNGSPAGLRMHEPIGLALAFLGLGQLLLATAWWRTTGGRWTAPAASLLILAGEVVQIAMGYSRQMAIHVPLGIALVAATVVFAFWVNKRQVVVA